MTTKPRTNFIEDELLEYSKKNKVPPSVCLTWGGSTKWKQRLPAIKDLHFREVNNSIRSIKKKYGPPTPKPTGSNTSTSQTNVSNNFAGGESANKIKISLSITAAIEGNKENNTTLINDASIDDGQKKTSPAQAPAQHVEGIDDGQKEPPPAPVRYVEGVTTTNFVRGSLTEVKVYKPYADASLGIGTYDSKQGEVKILKIEDGSPMGPLLEGPLEVGMAIIAVNNEEITSSEKFKEIYNKCQVGKMVVIKVGPKKMSEALNIIEDLDRQRKLLVRDNKDLENENQQLVRDNQRLQKQLEKQTADASHFRVMARTLEMTSLD